MRSAGSASTEASRRFRIRKPLPRGFVRCSALRLGGLLETPFWRSATCAGGLRETPFWRSATCASLSRPVHPSSGDFEPPARRPFGRDGHFPLARLRPQEQETSDGAACRRVPASVPAARAAAWIRPHPPPWRFRAVVSSGGKCSVGCPSARLPPAGQTSVAMLRQGSPREIRISNSRSGIRARLPRSHKGRAASTISVARHGRSKATTFDL